VACVRFGGRGVLWERGFEVVLAEKFWGSAYECKNDAVDEGSRLDAELRLLLRCKSAWS
jgi:hypothetical protein